MTAAMDLINLKDLMHQKWFELQYAKRADKEHAFLQKPIYDEIIRLGHQALDIIKEAKPGSSYIGPIEIFLHETQRKSWTADDIGYIGPKPYYVMTPEAAQSAITWDINHLANAIHLAGMSLIKSAGVYCGCQVSEGIEDLSFINTGAMKYCQGVLKMGRYKERAAILLEPGDRIEHRPGSATNHANVMRFLPTEKGMNVDMEYTESGDENWRLRQEGVLAFVKQKNGVCDSSDGINKCHLENLPEDDILELALFISQLADIDLLSANCIPLALELITDQAKELKLAEPEKIWKEPWTRVNDMEKIMDCREKHLDEPEESRRRGTLYKRLELSIQDMDESMTRAIKESETSACITATYNKLAVNDFEADIRSDCKHIAAETQEPWDWCMDLADQREKERKEAAKKLVERCPPEGIILAAEADNAFISVDRIEEICKLAQNLDCLAIIKQVNARYQAGIKPGTLKLKVKQIE